MLGDNSAHKGQGQTLPGHQERYQSEATREETHEVPGSQAAGTGHKLQPGEYIHLALDLSGAARLGAAADRLMVSPRTPQSLLNERNSAPARGTSR